MFLLMVIDNLHLRWAGRFFEPFKANPPLVIDADAVWRKRESYQRWVRIMRQMTTWCWHFRLSA